MFAARGGFLYEQATEPSGAFGNNLSFPNDSSQFLSTTSTTNLITWRTAFTIEYWLYMTEWPGPINPGPGNHDDASTNYWSFGPAADGKLEFYWWGPGVNNISTDINALSLNTWHAVAATFGPPNRGRVTVTLYIDGVRQLVQLNNTGTYATTKDATSGVVSTATVFGIGKYDTKKWNGFIDNLRVSNIGRYSGASYTLATGPFTYDANTQLLIEPTGSVGSSTIPYQSVSGNADMTNASNIVTIVNTHANHT